MAALARELARRHAVTVLTSRAGDLPPESLERGVRVLRVPVLFRRHLSVANFPSMLAYLPSAAWRAFRLRRSTSVCDVVNTHFVVPTGPAGQWIADRYGVPNVLSVHGGDLYDPSKQLSPHRHAWLRGPIRRLLQRADAVVAQSKNTVGNVSEIYGVQRPIDLIPLGIERPPAGVVASRGSFRPAGRRLCPGNGRPAGGAQANDPTRCCSGKQRRQQCPPSHRRKRPRRCSDTRGGGAARHCRSHSLAWKPGRQ